MKRIGVLTSGGDAPGMNAAIRAVVRTGLHYKMSVLGFKRGYNGILMRSADNHDDFEILTGRSVSNRIQRGGTFLMTARCLEFLQLEYQQMAVKNLSMLGIEGLVCIGGDGTYKGAEALSKLGMPVVGVPGTIDNDLNYTDYTIGFDTAINTACEAIDKIRDTSDSHGRISLITVMGRHSGDIAQRTAFASGAEVYMAPEKPWSFEEVAEKVKWGVLSGKRSMMLIMAEGALDSLTSDVDAICASYEKLNGIKKEEMDSSDVAKIIEVLSGHETRATVLGYIQRGGTPSASDRILATRMGSYAVELLNDGVHGVAVGVKEDRMISVPLSDVQKGKQPIDDELTRLFDITSQMAR